PGTTRDLLRASVALQGIPVHLVDTAGIRTTHDPVEVIGVERARAAAREADVVLRIRDCTRADAAQQEEAFASDAAVIHVHNKIDLAGIAPKAETRHGETHVWISARRGDGIDLLKDAIVSAAGAEPMTEGIFLARQRHLEALRTAL